MILVLTDAGLRNWWDDHALTTDTVAGLLVLMITVLIVDQVIRLRQGNSKARTVAVPGAILMYGRCCSTTAKTPAPGDCQTRATP